MKPWRIIYGLLWFITLIAYSLPWVKIDDKAFIGWNFTLPFSITYFIGILLGLIVFITKYKPVLMTIIAGILMIFGIVGASLVIIFAELFTSLTSALIGSTITKVSWEAGIGFAFFSIVIYMIVGTFAGRKMSTTSTKSQVKASRESNKCPKCGSGNIIAYMGEYECMNCGYKFTQIPQRIETLKPSISEAKKSNKGSLIKWIIIIIIVFFSGLFIGYGIGASPKEIGVKTITITSILTPTGVEVTKPYITTIIQPSILTTIQTITTTVLYIPTYTLEEETYTLGQKIEIDNWEIIVSEVKRTDMIILQSILDPEYGSLCEPKRENYEFFIVNFSIKNIGKKSSVISFIGDFLVITIENYTYKYISFRDMNEKDRGKIDELSKKYPKVLIINELDTFKTLDPEETTEGWIIFSLPKDKIIKEITFDVNFGLRKIIIHVKL